MIRTKGSAVALTGSLLWISAGCGSDDAPSSSTQSTSVTAGDPEAIAACDPLPEPPTNTANDPQPDAEVFAEAVDRVASDPSNAGVFFDPSTSGFVASYTTDDPTRDADLLASLAPWAVEVRRVRFTQAALEQAADEARSQLAEGAVAEIDFDVRRNAVRMRFQSEAEAAAFAVIDLPAPISMYCLDSVPASVEPPAGSA
jgi:hypothetical protein